MTIRVLADRHHGCLWESLELLFTDRFGWDLFCPIGYEWRTSGIWAHEPHRPEVAHQFLDFMSTDRDCGSHWERVDSEHPHRTIKMLTLDQVRQRKVDLIICTLPDNEPGMHNLARQMGAKFGVQMGNVVTRSPQELYKCYERADFLLLSTKVPIAPNKPFVEYHQEFSLQDYRFEFPPRKREAATWVHLIGNTPVFRYFDELAKRVPELEWKCYGHKDVNNPYWSRSIATCPEVAKSMREATIHIVFKTWGDGYGHVVHNAFAVGRPVIATASYYRDKLAGPLFEDGINSMDVQAHSIDEVVAFIRRLLEDQYYLHQVCLASWESFNRHVNFDKEAEKIRQMLNKILND